MPEVGANVALHEAKFLFYLKVETDSVCRSRHNIFVNLSRVFRQSCLNVGQPHPSFFSFLYPHLVFPAPLYLYSSGIIVNGNSLGGRLGAAPSFACEMDVLFSVRCCLNVGIVCIEVSPSSPHYPVSVMWCG